MFLRVGGGKNRVGAAVALAAVLAMAQATPAGAAPWGSFGEVREITSGFLPRVLAWLGFSPDRSASVKCDHGSTIDPNGCPKAAGDALPASVTGGARVVPVHRR
jgi:hypothetical protein